MKKKLAIMLLLCLVSGIIFADGARYYRTKEGYSGYVKLNYQCMNGERGFTIDSINDNLYGLANAFGFNPFPIHLSEAHWCLLEDAFQRYGGKDNAIYNVSIQVDGEGYKVQSTFCLIKGKFYSKTFAHYGPL